MSLDRTEYRGAFRRIADLGVANEDRLDTQVIACPVWTCRDLIGHLVGISEDWVNGTLDRYASESWTWDEIDRYRDDDLVALIGQWAATVERLDQVADHPVMGEPWRWLFGDAQWWVGMPAGQSVTLTTDPYLLWRFLHGRLDRSSVESLGWSADPATFLDRGLPYPFSFPSSGNRDTN